MNAKKLLSFVLALVMVCSMMANLTVTASAGASNTCTYDSAEKAITVQLSVPTKLTIGSTPEPIEMTVDGSFCDCTAHYLKQDVAYYEGYDQEVYTAYNNYLWLPEDTVSAAVTYAYCVFGEMKNTTDFANVELTVNGQTCELIAVDDYYFYFFVVIGTTDANGNITGAAPNECYLDLESSTTDILDSKELDQNYNLTVEEGDKTDVTKVKLSWTISDINAVRADNKVWDTTELKWVDKDSVTTVTDNGSATFKLENYSSVKVDAAVSFATVSDFHPTVTFGETTGEDGKITLDTANGNETYSKTNVPTGTIHVTVTPGEDDFKGLNATTTAKLYGVYTVTISECAEEQPGGDCLAKGTKITMANGTLKNIEDITEGDKVLTYNHEAGRFEAQKVYLAWAGESPKCAFTLHFTNGIEISVIGDHCFFEKESLSYVAIFDNTAEEFIGKHFYNAAAGRYEELLFVTYDTTPVDYYEIYTEYNANCVAEGMLNVAYDSSEVLNIYKFNEDLTIDHEQLASDIAEYGIFEYVENDRYSKKIYDALGWKYGYVMIGKGFGTADEFRARMDAFLAD